MTERCICLLPRVSGIGGMVSFQQKMIAGVETRGICVSQQPKPGCQAVLVIGGTRHLGTLLRLRRSGVTIVQRLNGMNWLHRWGGRRRSGVKHYLRAEYGNWLLRTIRDRIAGRVVYQSDFARRWWERVYGPAPVPARVIYNGVDLNSYSSRGSEAAPEDCWRILMVEGSLMGGYEQGMEAAVGLVERLHSRLFGDKDQERGPSQPDLAQEAAPATLTGSPAALGKSTVSQKLRRSLPVRPLELVVVGQAPAALRQLWTARLAQHCPGDQASIRWVGPVTREQIPALDRAAHLLYASDINAACPNSVIEALACGLPVLAFDTGALPEMVPPSAGRVVAYGGDPWLLEPPDLEALAGAAEDIFGSQADLRPGARERAELMFGLDRMVEAYLEVLFEP